MTIKNHLPGEPIEVELSVREGRRVVFQILAENRPTAVHEARRFLKLDVAWAEGAWDEYSDELRDVWFESFGIVGWSAYDLETVRA